MSQSEMFFGKDLFAGVNEVCDPRNPSGLERRHIPEVHCPAAVRVGEPFAVEIEVGREFPHPSDENHRIHALDVFADKTLLARVDVEVGQAGPRATVWVTLAAPAKELLVHSHCNRHGAWLSRTALNVVEA